MAEALKREHELMSLRVELAFWAKSPLVRISFESGGTAHSLWQYSAESVGVPTSLADGGMPALALPHEHLQELAQLCAAHARHGANEPLWLHLVRPYGFAGALPWEETLAPVIDRPLLRLPDFLERSQEDPDTLEIAICYDPPWKSDRASADQRVVELIQTALQSPRAQIVVHFFTIDPSSALTALGNARLRWYDPQEWHKGQSSNSRGQAGGSAWLVWMADSLRPHALDAVHFVCGAEAFDDRASLLVRSTPFPTTSRPVLSAIQPGDIVSFLARTGAWAAIFSPHPQAPCAAACRFFADGIAQIRPGPVLFHAFEDEPIQNSALPALYNFLFASEPSDPPAFQAGFLYCQPTFARAYQDGAWGVTWEGRTRAKPFQRVLAKFSQSMDLLPDYILPETPVWTSAAQRYVEKLSLDSYRFKQGLDTSDLSSALRSEAEAANNAISDTLAQIQDVIARSTIEDK